jgi:imidazolonepropionase-like amidohydrolase
MELLVDAGLSPLEGSRASTITAARALGLPAVGLVAPGYEADLVALAGDPTQDSGEMREIRLVLRAGELVRGSY